MKKFVCPRCNAELYPDSVKCYSCGLVFKQQLNDSITIETGVLSGERSFNHTGNPICPNCFVPLYPDSVKCFSCGYSLPKGKVYIDDYIRKYLLIRNSINIPDSACVISYKDSSKDCPIKLNESNFPVLVWKENKGLFFFPYLSEAVPGEIVEMAEEYPDVFARYARLINNIIEPFSGSFSDGKNYPMSIWIDKIDYFERTGEVFHESKISGGGGGGVSIVGAIVGGIIAGGTGAIIGSRQRVNPIKSEIITHDARVTNLKFFDQYKNRHTLALGANAFEVLQDLIPEKEYGLVMANRSSAPKSEDFTDKKESNVIDLLREFAKLKDEGIITPEEFEAKKKQMLGL